MKDYSCCAHCDHTVPWGGSQTLTPDGKGHTKPCSACDPELYAQVARDPGEASVRENPYKLRITRTITTVSEISLKCYPDMTPGEAAEYERSLSFEDVQELVPFGEVTMETGVEIL
jgi:hypothetical protein